MSEGNAIRVIENQPEAAAIEIPHEVGRDRSLWLSAAVAERGVKMRR